MERDVLGRYHDGGGPTFRASADWPPPPTSAPSSPPSPPSPPSPADTLAFLRGTWRVRRRLVDHAAGTTGSFTGTARWLASGDGAAAGGGTLSDNSNRPGGEREPLGDNSNRPRGEPSGGLELTYRESGELRFGVHRGPASRSLIYRGRADGTADVTFADGRPFYHLDPRPGSWQARHDCGRDEYLLAGRRLDTETIEERWRVRGPDKDYEITTTLVRA